MSFPADTKAPQAALLPTYQIDESQEELVVGKTGCCRRFRGWKKTCHTRTRAERVKRGFKFFFGFLLIAGAFFAFFHHRYHPRPHFCNDIVSPIETPKTELTLPFAHRDKLIMLSSVTSGNSEIIKDKDVADDQVIVTLEFAEPKSDVEKEDDNEGEEPKMVSKVCAIKFRRGIGLGIFTRSDDDTLPTLIKTTIRISSNIRSPAIIFAGDHERRWHGRCLKKLVRSWWRNTEEEKPTLE